MKKYAQRVQVLANKYYFKYAQNASNELQKIIESAASWGEQSENGIMNYPALLKQDQGNLTISVTISSGIMGGKSVQISTPTLVPFQLGSKYTKLPAQIKKYLEKHINNFPQITDGTYTIEYQGNPADSVAAN